MNADDSDESIAQQHVCFFERPSDCEESDFPEITDEQWEAIEAEWRSLSPRRMLTEEEVNEIIARMPR